MSTLGAEKDSHYLGSGAELKTIGEADLVIVGAGIIGLAHAYEASKRGQSVIVLERDSSCVGASIRNFGHACFSAQGRDLYDLAMTSRSGWVEVCESARLWARQCGTVVAARSELELQVLQQVHQNRPDDIELLTGEEVSRRLSGLAPDALGGAYLPLDMRVDPRTTVSRLADYLETERGVQLMFSTAMLTFETASDGITVRTTRGLLRCQKLLICVGHDLDYLSPDAYQDAGIQRCCLNMLRVKTPGGVDIEPAIFSSTSISRYGAFQEVSAAADLAADLADRKPALVAIGANVMATQLPDGTMLLGDTHHYGRSAPPFISEEYSNLVADDMANLLGVEGFEVLERWQGVYADSPKQVVLRTQLAADVQAVTVTSGVGMTLSFGIAAQTLSAF